MKAIVRWRVVRWVVLGLVVVLLGIQLVPVARSNPAVSEEVAAPPEARAILRRACYDCHSNQTTWPWYSRVAPASWLLAYDVREGRRELNFSTWDQYSPAQRAKMMKECVEQVDKGEMPPWYYVPMHREASLAEQDKAMLKRWAVGG